MHKTNLETASSTEEQQPKIKSFLSHHKKALLGLFISGVLALILIVVGSNVLIDRYGKYVLNTNDPKHTSVGLVLGAGITKDGKPFKELQARLDLAAQALQDGRVDKLILSGDNRYNGYDEPTAMLNYLLNKGVSRDKLEPDFAGRSTYESCERAAKVFKVKETIIFSAHSHLPRAIFLCRKFGVEAYGLGTNLEANNYRRREPIARVKAVFNVYILGERTVL